MFDDEGGSSGTVKKQEDDFLWNWAIPWRPKGKARPRKCEHGIFLDGEFQYPSLRINMVYFSSADAGFLPHMAIIGG